MEVHHKKVKSNMGRCVICAERMAETACASQRRKDSGRAWKDGQAADAEMGRTRQNTLKLSPGPGPHCRFVLSSSGATRYGQPLNA